MQNLRHTFFSFSPIGQFSPGMSNTISGIPENLRNISNGFTFEKQCSALHSTNTLEGAILLIKRHSSIHLFFQILPGIILRLQLLSTAARLSGVICSFLSHNSQHQLIESFFFCLTKYHFVHLFTHAAPTAVHPGHGRRSSSCRYNHQHESAHI